MQNLSVLYKCRLKYIFLLLSLLSFKIINAEQQIAQSNSQICSNDVLTGITLSRQLIDFSGKIREDGVIELNWKTVSEVNVYQFEAEYSTDGEHYQKFGVVPATNSTNGNTYKIYHAIAYNGKVAYRLKMIDNDGSFLYSDIIRLELKNSGDKQ